MSTDNKIIEKLSEDVKKYIELNAELFRISSLEKAASIMAFSIIAIIVSVLLFFTFIFANMFLAVYLGYIFDSWPIGFGVFAGSYVLVTLLIVVFWKRTQRFLYNRFVVAILESVEEEEAQHNRK